MLKLVALILFTSSMALAAPAASQSAPDVADLVGARAAGGETQLEARGYSLVTTNTVRDTRFTTWWNARQSRCISVATANGRYDAINRIPEDNCRGSGDGDRNRDDEDRPAFVDDRSDRRDDQRRAPAFGEGGDRVTLVCYGSGSGLKTQMYSGYGYNNDSDRFEPQFGTTIGRQGFSSDVQLEISDGRGRIHLVGQMVSPIHSGGFDGWWPIQDLVITRDRITGSYRMNGFNKPRFEIDRRSGTIRIKASTDFNGRCDVGNWRSGF